MGFWDAYLQSGNSEIEAISANQASEQPGTGRWTGRGITSKLSGMFTAVSPLPLPLFKALWRDSIVSNIRMTMNDAGAVRSMMTTTGFLSNLRARWAENLRQHERATVGDQRVEQSVVAFHRGDSPPRVRHLLTTNLREQS